MEEDDVGGEQSYAQVRGSQVGFNQIKFNQQFFQQFKTT